MADPLPTRAGSRELDDVTLARAQRGEAAACRALVLQYQRPVFALLSRMLAPSGRIAMVEDLAQETFLRAFRALSAFDRGGRARLSTWILTIATRLCIDELRKNAQTEPLEKASHVAAPARSDARLEARAIARAVAQLAPEYRAAFLLRELHDLEYDEIARALGVDLGTVKSRLARARAALREALAEEPNEA
jgi:RNA polymerase sigma-70 factor (ECF subfamily)